MTEKKINIVGESEQEKELKKLEAMVKGKDPNEPDPKSILDIVNLQPVNKLYKETNDKAPNWLVFIFHSSKMQKRFYVRIHPYFIYDTPNCCFTEKCLDVFHKAWEALTLNNPLRVELLSNPDEGKAYLTFLVNKISHLTLTSRDTVIFDGFRHNFYLEDVYITNN